MFSKTPSQLFFPASYGISCTFFFSSSFSFSSSGNGTNDSRRRRLEKLTLDLLLFPGEKKPKPSKTGGLRHPCRLRPLPERLESPPRPGKVEGRRRIHPGAVWPRRRRRCCEGGGGMPSERQPRVAFCRLRFRFVSLFYFVCRPERDHRVFFVPAFRRGQAQVHRGPVCAFRERDGSGDLCAEGKFMKFCFWRLFEHQRRFGKGIKRKNSPLFA